MLAFAAFAGAVAVKETTIQEFLTVVTDEVEFTKPKEFELESSHSIYASMSAELADICLILVCNEYVVLFAMLTDRLVEIPKFKAAEVSVN
jgi:hypothetical protein